MPHPFRVELLHPIVSTPRRRTAVPLNTQQITTAGGDAVVACLSVTPFAGFVGGMCSKPLRRLALEQPVAESLALWFGGMDDVVLGDIITCLPDAVSLMEVTGVSHAEATRLLVHIASEACPTSSTVRT